MFSLWGSVLSFRSISLLQAVTSKDEGAVKSLLAQNADVDSRNSSGQTPLILSIISGQDHILRLLLKAGANPLLRDHTELNAIDWAERKGRTDIAEILRTTQPGNSSTNLDHIESERKTTQPPVDELRNVPPVSPDEKSLKWLAGIKQRWEEEERAERKNQRDPSPSQR